MPFSGRKLQALRKAAGLSQSELAVKAGLSFRSIQNWEIERRKPKVDALLTLAKVLGVSLNDFLTPAKARKKRK